MCRTFFLRIHAVCPVHYAEEHRLGCVCIFGILSCVHGRCVIVWGEQKRLLAWLIPDLAGFFYNFPCQERLSGGVYYTVALCGDVAIRHLHTPRYIRGDVMPWRRAAAAG